MAPRLDLTPAAFALVLALQACAPEREASTPAPSPAPAPAPAHGRSPHLAIDEAPARSAHPGVVLPHEEVKIRAATAGVVLELAVQPGDVVDVGDVIARLDRRQAVADLRVARADLRTLEGERRALDLAARAAEQEHARTQQLHDDGFASRSEVDAAALEAERATAAVAQVDARRRGVQATIELLDDALEDRWLRAPLAGVVASIPVSAGERVGPDDVVARLVTASGMRVRFAIAPAVRDDFRPGDPVLVHTAKDQPPRSAHVVSVAPEVDPAADLVFIDSALDDASVSLTVGLGVRVTPKGAP